MESTRLSTLTSKPGNPELLAALRKAGLPLDYYMPDDDSDDKSGKSQITAIAEVLDSAIRTTLVTPSGLIYELDTPEDYASWSERDLWTWQFAARNYYWVTGNHADRKKIAELTHVDDKLMKGRAISKNKDTLSGLSTNKLLAELGHDPKVAQARLF